MNSPSPSPLRSSSRSSDSSSRLAKVKCSFCGNTFYAIPREAVCRKCNRPANRPLSLPLRVAAFLLPLVGFIYSAWIRPHSPFAATQGFIASGVGLLLDIIIYAARHLL